MVKVSVIMANYNGGEYLKEAINSVISQTLSQWELIIIDDESKDNSIEIVQGFNDSRIKLFRSGKNSGPAICRNIGLNNSKGKYITILDSDDVMTENRLETQYNYLESNPNIDVLGTAAEYFGNGKRTIVTPFLDHETIKCKILFDSPFTHSSVMIRKITLTKYNVKYNESYPKAQDYDLWAQLASFDNVTFGSIDKVLVRYRIHGNQITSNQKGKQKEYANSIRKRQLKLLISGISENELDWLCNNLATYKTMNVEELRKFENYIKIIISNSSAKYNLKSVRTLCAQIFRNQCIFNLINKDLSGDYYWKSSIRSYDNIKKITKIKMKLVAFLLKFRGGKVHFGQNLD